MNEPTLQTLSERLARFEERMNTKQAEYKTDIALLAKENAERETRHVCWTIGSVVAATMVIIAALKFF